MYNVGNDRCRALSHGEVKRMLIWPDPVPCRPENPVQGIWTCVAQQKNIKCACLRVNCGVSTDDMSEAPGELSLDDLNWILEDELDQDDAAEVATEVRKARGERAADRSEAASAIRLFADFLDLVQNYGEGLTSRFVERIDLRDRY